MKSSIPAILAFNNSVTEHIESPLTIHLIVKGFRDLDYSYYKMSHILAWDSGNNGRLYVMGKHISVCVHGSHARANSYTQL